MHLLWKFSIENNDVIKAAKAIAWVLYRTDPFLKDYLLPFQCSQT